MNILRRVGCMGEDWSRGLPELPGWRTRLREVRRSDAPALVDLTGRPEVVRFLPPPLSVVGMITTVPPCDAPEAP